MRNSLVAKYQRVKYFCAIKSYARNVNIFDIKVKTKIIEWLENDDAETNR